MRWIEKCGFYICWVVRTVGVISVRTIYRNKLNCFSRVASAFSPKKNDRIFRLSWSDVIGGWMFRPGTFRLLAVGCSQRTVPSARATCPTYSPKDSEVTAEAAGPRAAAAAGAQARGAGCPGTWRAGDGLRVQWLVIMALMINRPKTSRAVGC